MLAQQMHLPQYKEQMFNDISGKIVEIRQNKMEQWGERNAGDETYAFNKKTAMASNERRLQQFALFRSHLFEHENLWWAIFRSENI